MLKKEPRREELLVNMTPMIDVMIFLIIFFLAATNFAEIEREQEILLPEAKGTTGSLSRSLDRKLVINIKKDGAVVIDGKSCSVEQLKSVLAHRRASLKDTLKVEIRADKRTLHGDVAAVLVLVREAGIATPSIDTKQATLEP